MKLPISIRLAIRQWAARPLRPILCSLAIAAAVALIVCVGAAMDSLRYSIAGAIGQALGVAEEHVRPAQRETDARLSQEMLERVRAMPEVDFADGRLASQAVLTKDEGPIWFDVIGVDEPLDDKLRPKNFVTGRALSGSPDELLIDGLVAERMKLKVGDEISYTIKDQPARKLKVVGVMPRPPLELLARPTLFVPLAVLAKDLGIKPEYNVIDIKLKDSAGIEDYEGFAKVLESRLGKSVEVTPGTTSKAKLGELTQTLRLFLLLLSMLSAICASLIIGTTLSVGVQERVRQFGQLRCLGASRGQLAVFLLGDAGVMLVIGEVLGGILGVLLSIGLVAWFPTFFSAYRLSVVSGLIAMLCGGVATMLGGMIPIWQVTRVPPMAAVTAASRRARMSRVWLAGAAGIGCIAVQVVLWALPLSRDARLYAYIGAGVPLVFGGWCLLAPGAISLCEKAGARVLGLVFGVRSSLLRSAWSRTPWRVGAMIAALMVGITLFVTVQARVLSIKNSWVTPRIPDLVVKSLLSGLGERRIERLKREHPEIREVAPFEYFTVHMKGDATELGKLLGDDESIFVAVEPRQFASMVNLEFIEGDPRTAIAQLEAGKHVFVTSEFKNVRKLGVGDKVTLRRADGNETEFTIAAVVESTGMEIVKNFFDLRASFAEKASSSVLGSLADGRENFKMKDPTLALLNVDPAYADAAHMAELRQKLTMEGLQSLSSVEIKRTIATVLGRVQYGLSIVGIGAMCVASLGVANMVIASVHARRYEFGVLRAIGAGRWQVVRLVLAEATLVGVVAGILGCGAGLWFAYMATLVDWLVLGFPTSFIDPHWLQALIMALELLGAAVGITVLLAWLASLAPAVRGAMMAQRAILAAGRA